MLLVRHDCATVLLLVLFVGDKAQDIATSLGLVKSLKPIHSLTLIAMVLTLWTYSGHRILGEKFDQRVILFNLLLIVEYVQS